MQTLKMILGRLKNPVVVLSIASQLISLFVLMGYHVNESLILSLLAIVCSILIALGIMTNPAPRGEGGDSLLCSTCEEKTLHIQAGKSRFCSNCGKIHTDSAAEN